MTLMMMVLSATLLEWVMIESPLKSGLVLLWIVMVILLCWKKMYAPSISIVLGVVIGLVCLALPMLSKTIANSCLNTPHKVNGEIISIPQYRQGHLQFDFRITDNKCSCKIRLNWYGFLPDIRAGDQWQLLIKIKPLHPVTQPGQFDYAKWLKSESIEQHGYVITSPENQLLQLSAQKISINALRQKISSMIYHNVKWQALAAVLVALTTGSRHLLLKENWQVFQNTGTSHLIAISGLHVSLVAGLFYWIGSQTWRLFPRLMLYYPLPKVSALLALIAAIFYAILAGLSVPTVRALIMLSVVLLASIWHRHLFLWYRLLFALSLVLIISPYAALSISFWLSFFAVALLGYCSNARLYTSRGMLRWLQLQILLFIGLAPLTLLFFGKISLVMIIANLVAIPYVSFLVVPACLLATAGYFMLPWDHYLWWLAAKSLAPLWWYLTTLSHWPHIIWQHGILQGWIFVSLLASVLLLLAPKGFPGRRLAIIFALPLFF